MPNMQNEKNPSPDPRRLKKTPSRAALSPRERVVKSVSTR
jgi:hypothetical protein